MAVVGVGSSVVLYRLLVVPTELQGRYHLTAAGDRSFAVFIFGSSVWSNPS